MSTPNEEFDDFEYELADAEPRTTCPFCGAQLAQPGSCESCGQEIDLSPPPEPHPENPEPEKPDGWAAYLEMEESEGDLPASFYAVALGIVVLVALASILSNAPSQATQVIGMLTVLAGAFAVAAGYRWMSQQLQGGFRDHLSIPFRAVGAIFVKSDDPPPQAPSVDVAKWGLLAIVGGVLLWLAGFLIGLAY